MLRNVQLCVALVEELTVKVDVLPDELEVLNVEEKFELHKGHVLALDLSEEVRSHIVDELVFSLWNSHSLSLLWSTIIVIAYDLLIINKRQGSLVNSNRLLRLLDRSAELSLFVCHLFIK